MFEWFWEGMRYCVCRLGVCNIFSIILLLRLTQVLTMYKNITGEDLDMSGPAEIAS
jgi:hypothetical protein